MEIVSAVPLAFGILVSLGVLCTAHGSGSLDLTCTSALQTCYEISRDLEPCVAAVQAGACLPLGSTDFTRAFKEIDALLIVEIQQIDEYPVFRQQVAITPVNVDDTHICVLTGRREPHESTGR